MHEEIRKRYYELVGRLIPTVGDFSVESVCEAAAEMVRESERHIAELTKELEVNENEG